MRLLIEDYLRFLKEDKELENIVASLTTSMGLDRKTLPQKGAKQSGADMHVIGIDPEDGIKKNFIFVIKRGDIDRQAWSGNEQGVRATIDEVLDAYIPNMYAPAETPLPTKIIVCCGGDLKQTLLLQWTGLQKKHNTTEQLKLELWNGSKLSEKIEKFLFTEYIFFEKDRSDLRKTLAFVADNHYDLRHFKKLLRNVLHSDNWKKAAKKKKEENAVKAISAIQITVLMIEEYSKEAKNSKIPFIAAEYAILSIWNFMQQNDLLKSDKINRKFFEMYLLYQNAGVTYINAIQPNSRIRDGIARGSRNSINASQVTFESIGLLSCLGVSQLFHGIKAPHQTLVENASETVNTLKEIIQNNGISKSPVFDGMTIDICIAIFYLCISGEREFAAKWMQELVERFRFSYVVLGRGFPIWQDSLDILIDFEKNHFHDKEEMMALSTLLSTLAYWCVVLELKDCYNSIYELVSTHLKDSTLQVWFPAKGIKNSFFSQYSGNEGITEGPIELPKDFADLKSRVDLLIKKIKENDQFETEWYVAPVGLEFMASRCFRTPVIPLLWLDTGFFDKINK